MVQGDEGGGWATPQAPKNKQKQRKKTKENPNKINTHTERMNTTSS